MSRSVASLRAQFLLRVVFAILALLVHVQTSYAKPNVSAQKALQASIQKSLPGFEIHQVDEMDTLAAAIITRPIKLNDEHEIRLAVFERNGQSYQLLAFSEKWNHYLLHRQGWSIQVKNQSILLSFGGSTSCCSGIDQVLRFRKIGDSIRLVGEETKTYGYEGREDEKYYETRVSINYLSGRVIHSKRSGPKKDNEQELGFGKQPKLKEVQLSFPVTETLELSNFSPDGYFLYQKGVPELCGYINEKMKYEPCKEEKHAG